MQTLLRHFYWLAIMLAVFFGTVAGFYVGQFSVQSAYAQTIKSDPRDALKESGSKFVANVEEVRDPREIIFSIVRLLLTIVGTALMLVILYAGYLWFSARGNDNQVKKAKATLRNGIIGMLIVGMSYAFVNFIFRSVFRPVNKATDPGSAGQQIFENQILEGDFPAPSRNDPNTPRLPGVGGDSGQFAV